jgi:AsmA protein
MQFDKRVVKITGIAIAVVVVILIALPLFINIDGFRPKIESALTDATRRQVSLGKLSLSLMSGKVSVDDVTIADDPAFSKSSFITAKSLEVGVELMPLIFSKQLDITGIVLDEHHIRLLKSAYCSLIL